MIRETSKSPTCRDSSRSVKNGQMEFSFGMASAQGSRNTVDHACSFIAMISSLSISFLDRPLISLFRFSKFILHGSLAVTHIILFQQAVEEGARRSVLGDDIARDLYIPVKNSER